MFLKVNPPAQQSDKKSLITENKSAISHGAHDCDLRHDQLIVFAHMRLEAPRAVPSYANKNWEKKLAKQDHIGSAFDFFF